MRRVKITLPATLTNIGPGLRTLGLAVGLRTSLEFTERGDNTLTVNSFGQDATRYKDPLQHPAILAAIRVFQARERAPLGFGLRIDNPIPLRSGLGAETAFVVAGTIGAANLLDEPLPRDDLLQLAAQRLGSADGVVAAALGGLTAGALDNDTLHYRALAPAQMQVVVVYPKIKHYHRKAEKALNKIADYDDVVFHLSRLPLLIDAFQQADFEAVGALLEDRIHTPNLIKNHPHYEDAVAAAQAAGAAGVTLTGLGPGMVAFTRHNHDAVAAAMCAVFEANDVEVQSWVLPVDRQGIVVSVTQSV
jgi:homoserine kinase